MKKYFLLLVILLAWCEGCQDAVNSSGGNSYPNLRGVWDFTLIPTAAGDKTYTVTVERSGGSGAALVSIAGPLFADTARVSAGAPLPVGPCGVEVTFGDTAGWGLVAGDNWRIAVIGGNPGLPIPGDTVDSTVGAVTAGGQDTCASKICDGSALGSALPQASRGLGGAGVNSEWLSVPITQSGGQLTATVPELHALSLYLGTVELAGPPPIVLPPLIAVGDLVTLSFRRRVAGNGGSGDFFRVMVLNGPDLLDAEYRHGAGVSAGDTVLNFSFTALSPEVRVDFVAGLSGFGGNAQIDDLKVTNPGGTVFLEGFDAGPDAGCGPLGLNAPRLETRSPVWSVGRLCVSANHALAGTYSLRWDGGSRHSFSGSLLTQSSLSGMASLLGGLGGFLGGSSALSGLFASAWEPDLTYFLTTFSAAAPSAGAMVGTFKGESHNHDCVEMGDFAATLHLNHQTDLADADWVMRMEGSANHCDPPLASGDTIMFGDTLSTLTGDTIRMIQIGGSFLAAEDPTDNYGNTVTVRGQVSGNLLMVSLADPAGTYQAAGLGVISGSDIQGALTGRLRFDGGRVCELYRGSSFRVKRVGK